MTPEPAEATPAEPQPVLPTMGERLAAEARAAAGAIRGLIARPDGPLACALVLAAAALVETFLYTNSGSDRTSALLINLAATLPLALARSRPLVSAVVITGAVMLMIADVCPLTVSAFLALLTVLYIVATRYPRAVSIVFAAPFVVNLIAPLRGSNGSLGALLILVLVVAAQALGDAERRRERIIAERDESRAAMVDSVRERTALEERARIAREMHDVVAHHVSMIAVQADATRLTTPDMPEAGAHRLEEIAQTARDALNEMRRLLGVLRAGANGVERAPQPGLAQLDDLLEDARGAGTPVRLSVDGAVRTLPAGVDMTAYRIAQEALTNARQHAHGANVELDLHFGGDSLHLSVRDHGPGPAPHALEGHGILGMRERVTMVGGQLQTGAAVGGGFAVEAELPIATPT